MQAHYETFAAEVDAQGTSLPQFVKDEFETYLECGILAHGFMRLRCDVCARDTLVAFSCKRRGICPSCGTRRMAETAAYLVDNILSHVPVEGPLWRKVYIGKGSVARFRRYRKLPVDLTLWQGPVTDGHRSPISNGANGGSGRTAPPPATAASDCSTQLPADGYLRARPAAGGETSHSSFPIAIEHVFRAIR